MSVSVPVGQFDTISCSEGFSHCRNDPEAEVRTLFKHCKLPFFPWLTKDRRQWQETESQFGDLNSDRIIFFEEDIDIDKTKGFLKWNETWLMIKWKCADSSNISFTSCVYTCVSLQTQEQGRQGEKESRLLSNLSCPLHVSLCCLIYFYLSTWQMSHVSRAAQKVKI